MANETKTQISNWNENEIGNTGRFVEVKDDCGAYIAALPHLNSGGDAYDLADAISYFSSTYDLNGEAGNVPCSARMYADGVEVESRQFVIEAEAVR